MVVTTAGASETLARSPQPPTTTSRAPPSPERLVEIQAPKEDPAARTLLVARQLSPRLQLPDSLGAHVEVTSRRLDAHPLRPPLFLAQPRHGDLRGSFGDALNIAAQGAATALEGADPLAVVAERPDQLVVLVRRADEDPAAGRRGRN